jgi:hypothetical protein
MPGKGTGVFVVQPNNFDLVAPWGDRVVVAAPDNQEYEEIC